MANFPQSPDIGQKPDEDISDFWISSQSPIKVNCHNSRTIHSIDMKSGPVTKLDKGIIRIIGQHPEEKKEHLDLQRGNSFGKWQ